MRKTIAFVGLFFVLGCSMHGQEKITLGAPVLADPGVTEWQVSMLHLDWFGAEIVIRLMESSGGVIVPGGKQLGVTYRDATATSLMRALNKADLSVKSLQRRIIERLQADGHLGAGSITGSPQ